MLGFHCWGEKGQEAGWSLEHRTSTFHQFGWIWLGKVVCVEYLDYNFQNLGVNNGCIDWKVGPAREFIFRFFDVKFSQSIIEEHCFGATESSRLILSISRLFQLGILESKWIEAESEWKDAGSYWIGNLSKWVKLNLKFFTWKQIYFVALEMNPNLADDESTAALNMCEILLTFAGTSLSSSDSLESFPCSGRIAFDTQMIASVWGGIFLTGKLHWFLMKRKHHTYLQFKMQMSNPTLRQYDSFDFV